MATLNFKYTEQLIISIFQFKTNVARHVVCMPPYSDSPIKILPNQSNKPALYNKNKPWLRDSENIANITPNQERMLYYMSQFFMKRPVHHPVNSEETFPHLSTSV